jgi:hypothetical protein
MRRLLNAHLPVYARYCANASVTIPNAGYGGGKVTLGTKVAWLYLTINAFIIIFTIPRV